MGPNLYKNIPLYVYWFHLSKGEGPRSAVVRGPWPGGIRGVNPLYSRSETPRPKGSADSSTLRAPADPFARSAVSSQRSLLAAQFSRSAVSVLPSKPGRVQGWAKGPMQKAQGQRAQGTKGPFGPFGPRGPSDPLGPFGAQGGALIRNKCYP